MKRKSPVRHKVKSHTRQRKPVRSYVRGRGVNNPNPFVKKTKINKLLDRAEQQKNKPHPTIGKDIPYYTRDDLEKMFIGDDEKTVRETAKDLGFTFEAETYQGHLGEKTLEFRYPIDTDFQPGIQVPDARREVDLIFDLSTDRVVRVHSYMSHL